MTHNNFFNVYKYVLSGCLGQKDFEYFISDLSENDKSIFHTFNYQFVQSESYINFINLLEQIKQIKYKEDILIKLKDYSITNLIQFNVINRILKDKQFKINNINLFENNVLDKIIIKNCPHCNMSNPSNENNTYIICGYYSNRGFDDNGCGKDWCFSCGKKLCKNWTIHDLFLISNRFHNKQCCQNYAASLNLNYESDFCMCNNSYVNRIE